MTFDLHTSKSNLACILIPCTFISNFIKIRQTLLKLLNGNQICYGRTAALLYALPRLRRRGDNKFLNDISTNAYERENYQNNLKYMVKIK